MSTANENPADSLAATVPIPDAAATTPVQSLFTADADGGTSTGGTNSGTETGPAGTTSAAPAPTETPAAGHGPRTRWAAIVWGLVFAALAGGALYVVLSPQHRLELIKWVTSLEATTLALYGALAIGVIVLLFGLVGLLRRAQRALAARRTSAR